MWLCILVRHGESLYNVEKRINGDPANEVELSDHGREEASRLALHIAHVRIEVCVHTRFLRTLETARLALGDRVDRVPLVCEPLLDDINAGELEGRPLRWERPFRAPHHTISIAGLVGGGSGFGRPGEISRADHGVLFLDELAEFQPPALQSLRQPLETGRVTLTRSLGAVTYPARFTLVAATNPCPCGWAGDDRRACRCPPAAIERYQRSLSGPLLDRIDLRVAVSRPPLQALSGGPGGEASSAVRPRVIAARPTGPSPYPTSPRTIFP